MRTLHPRFPLRWLAVALAGANAVLGAPIPLPRLVFTVRGLMLAVAIAGLLIGARIGLAKRSERMILAALVHELEADVARNMAREHSLSALGWQYSQDESTAASDYRLAKQYWAEYARRDALREKYERAARYPWLPVAPDPREPE